MTALERSLQVGEIWKHSKTQGEYKILELGKLQTKNDLDMQDCVVYRSLSDNLVWVRPMEDFLGLTDDGNFRFVRIFS